MTDLKGMGPNFELSRKRKITNDNSGLPKGAMKCTDKEIGRLLEQVQVEKIRFNEYAGFSVGPGDFALKGCEFEESDFDSCTFNYQLSPTVEGYSWYRGFAVKVDGGMIFIFAGWMRPSDEGGAPDPIVYSTKGLSREEILKVVRIYCSRILSRIAEERLGLRKQAKQIAKEAYQKAKAEGANNMKALDVYNKAFDAAMKNE